MNNYLHRVLHPEVYRGHGKKPPYFEGWYFKIVDAREHFRFAIIPGIFMGKDNTHAFVQVLDGLTGKATYHSYPAEQFIASADVFDTRVGPNQFALDCLSLNIDDVERPINGELYFERLTPWQISLMSPGHMGFFAWMPFMEGYHDVLSFDHIIRGTLNVAGEKIDFTGGRGYMEKDRGQAFPIAYIWAQTNHFETPGTSLTGNIAITQSANIIFRGFVVGLWHDKRLYRFATYTGAKTEKLEITEEHVYWTVRDRQHRLELIATRAESTLLHAPVRTEMHKRVDETLKARVSVRLYALEGKNQALLFSGTGRNAGLEVHGDLEKLLKAL